ncbi:MAG: hypothetical protein J6B93_05220 [Clostridia bacterium]|nr:hypothetical protein [Clostridia bacterium]
MKKTIRNAIILTLAAVVLVVATVFTTMAYLVSTAKVSNVFTVGDVTIEMYESPVDEDGKIVNPVAVGEKKTADTNTYAIKPGGTYDKDPTVYVNPGSTECYLFVKARNQIDNIEYKEGTIDAGNASMKTQMVANGWKRIGKTAIGDWIYVYTGDAADDNDTDAFAQFIESMDTVQSFDLFKNFTIDPNCNNDKYKLAQGAAVTITAYAIQTEGFIGANDEVSKENVIKAWNAIVDKVDYEGENSKLTGNETIE